MTPSTNFGIFDNLKKDAPAGLVVFLVALPLCLGIALASGAPLFAGIIAGVAGGLVVGMASGSPLGVSGPAAGLTVIVLNAIDSMGTYEAFLTAVIIAGILQIILGYAKAGLIAYYFPSSVIKGMLAAIGLILILKQFPHLLGYDANPEGDLSFADSSGDNTFTTIIKAVMNPEIGAFIIGTLGLGILILWDSPTIKRNKTLKLIPGALIVVMMGIVMNEVIFPRINIEWVLSGTHLVNVPVVDSLLDYKNELFFPDLSVLTQVNTYVVAATIAIVASLETLLCVEATDKMDPYKRTTPTNQELKAQGLGNLFSGLIGGLPLTQVVVRSSANIESGGVTKMAAIIHGALLLLSVILIPTFLNLITLSSLAAVLLMVGYKLSKVALYRSMWRLGMDQFLPFMVTITAILFTDLLKGIMVGLVVSVFYILRNNYKRPYFYHKDKHAQGEKIHLKLSEDVSFLNKGSILLTLKKLPANSHVVLDGTSSESIDYDVLEIFENFAQNAPTRNITVEFVGIKRLDKIDSAH